MQHEAVPPVGRMTRPVLVRFDNCYIVSFADQVGGKLYAYPSRPYNNNTHPDLKGGRRLFGLTGIPPDFPAVLPGADGYDCGAAGKKYDVVPVIPVPLGVGRRAAVPFNCQCIHNVQNHSALVHRHQARRRVCAPRQPPLPRQRQAAVKGGAPSRKPPPARRIRQPSRRGSPSLQSRRLFRYPHYWY